MGNENSKSLGQIFGHLLDPTTQKIYEIYNSLEVHDLEDYQKLSTPDRHLCNVFWFEDRVMNGGIHEYICGSYGNFAQDCLHALGDIGAAQTYNYLKKACDSYPEGVPQDQETRNKLLRQRIGKVLLDEKVKGAIESDLYQKLLDYYSHHVPR